MNVHNQGGTVTTSPLNHQPGSETKSVVSILCLPYANQGCHSHPREFLVTMGHVGAESLSVGDAVAQLPFL